MMLFTPVVAAIALALVVVLADMAIRKFIQLKNQTRELQEANTKLEEMKQKVEQLSKEKYEAQARCIVSKEEAAMCRAEMEEAKAKLISRENNKTDAATEALRDAESKFTDQLKALQKSFKHPTKSTSDVGVSAYLMPEDPFRFEAPNDAVVWKSKEIKVGEVLFLTLEEYENFIRTYGAKHWKDRKERVQKRHPATGKYRMMLKRRQNLAIRRAPLSNKGSGFLVQ
ncbi:hypothetical protein BSKO_05615 [Bryopsis sp. KO-2023]|nr:hypothetical protein BSKO_05615 [Bryopsis sp. KO-2023]